MRRLADLRNGLVKTGWRRALEPGWWCWLFAALDGLVRCWCVSRGRARVERVSVGVAVLKLAAGPFVAECWNCDTPLNGVDPSLDDEGGRAQ